MEFKLNEAEEKRSKKWYKKLIKDHPDIFGKEHNRYPVISYIFTPTGIGIGVDLYEMHTKKKINVTDIDSW